MYLETGMLKGLVANVYEHFCTDNEVSIRNSDRNTDEDEDAAIVYGKDFDRVTEMIDDIIQKHEQGEVITPDMIEEVSSDSVMAFHEILIDRGSRNLTDEECTEMSEEVTKILSRINTLEENMGFIEDLKKKAYPEDEPEHILPLLPPELIKYRLPKGFELDENGNVVKLDNDGNRIPMEMESPSLTPIPTKEASINSETLNQVIQKWKDEHEYEILDNITLKQLKELRAELEEAVVGKEDPYGYLISRVAIQIDGEHIRVVCESLEDVKSSKEII